MESSTQLTTETTLLIQNLNKKGNSITVEGKVVRGGKSFALSLGRDAKNLVIYFEPDLVKGVIICKFKTDAQDGPEMTYPSCPFKQEEAAKISFSFDVTEKDTQVTVTLPDKTHFQFSSQLNLDHFEYILVGGDLVAKSVTIE